MKRLLSLVILSLLFAVALNYCWVRWVNHAIAPPTLDIKSVVLAATPTGELGVFKVISKDAITKTIGQGLNTTDPKKAILIVHSEINISYSLRDPRFGITRTGAHAVIDLPPAKADTNMKEIVFYDKKPGKWLTIEQPWTPEDDNQIIADARNDAQTRAQAGLEDFRTQYELVAQALLTAIARGLGCDSVEVHFLSNPPPPKQ